MQIAGNSSRITVAVESEPALSIHASMGTLSDPPIAMSGLTNMLPGELDANTKNALNVSSNSTATLIFQARFHHPTFTSYTCALHIFYRLHTHSATCAEQSHMQQCQAT
jgi:hypothetical protein